MIVKRFYLVGLVFTEIKVKKEKGNVLVIKLTPVEYIIGNH